MLDIQKAFNEGVPEYAPAVMWFPTGSVTRDEMTFQIESFKKSGIGDFYIHPSAGLRGGYLDEGFFAMIRHAVEEAQRLEMNFWIYDEYNWPSGTAGGFVIRDHPWARMTLLSMLKGEV